MDGRSFAKFLSLPVDPREVWQGGVVKLAELMGLPSGAPGSEMGVILWCSQPSGLAHTASFMDNIGLFDHFSAALLKLAKEQPTPCRPAQIECNDPHLTDELNKAINAQFVGRSLDEFELPRHTPAERAEAIYQEALGSFGRRRVLLARQALAEDPHHIEANILIAESTRSADRRIELFQNAKQAAAAALGDDMQELAGQFWGFHETRPYMRACHGLAVALADAGQNADAAEQYRDMLRLNPNDNQGVRYEVVPLLLEQGRDAEALAILDQYPEKSAQWLYAKALVEFRRGGRSAEAKRALHAAFKANDHVLRLLQSDAPPLMPESYSQGSPEEAAICIEELGAAWDESGEYMQWMFQEYFLWERDRAKRLRDQKRKSRQQNKRKR